MKRTYGCLLAFVAMTTALGCSARSPTARDPMKYHEVSPTIWERLTERVVKGTLLKVQGERYLIEDHDGIQIKVHVDETTNLDKVVEGDMVRAYLTDRSHVTTLQRVQY